MSIPLVINGTTFNYPQEFDTHWGPTLTSWSTAVTTGMLQTSGVNPAILIVSATANPAQSGFLEMAKTDTISWRNNADSADLPLGINSSNQLTFNGSPIGAATVLTDNHIFVGNASNQPADVAMSGDATIVASGALTIANGAITNAKIAASTGITLSKLAALTASELVVSDSSGFLISLASPSLTEIGYVAGVTSAIQTQINNIVTSQGNYLPLAGGIMSGVINMGSNKIISVAAGSNAGEVLSYGQALNGSSLIVSDGSVSAPSIALISVPSTGLYNSTPASVVAPAADWNTSTSVITVSNPYTFADDIGLAVQLTTTGSLPAGLSLATTYYIIPVTDGTSFALASSAANANAGTKIAYTTQGTGTHTVTVLVSGWYGIANNGVLTATFSGDNRMGLGGRPAPLNPAEMLHVERSTTPQAMGGEGSVDIIVMNPGTAGSRILTQAGTGQSTPAPVSYLGVSGTDDTGSWWSGGPAKDQNTYMQFQAGKNTVFDFFGAGSLTNADVYFWNENTGGMFHFNVGSTGTEALLISKTEITANVPINVAATSVSINEVGITSAILNAGSTTQGFLKPRMTTTQRDAISSPAEGLEIYNLTTHHPNYYNGSSWIQL